MLDRKLPTALVAAIDLVPAGGDPDTLVLIIALANLALSRKAMNSI